jgi:hypothetical protein
MRKIIATIVAVLGIAASGAFFSGCYTDAVDNLSTFTFQLPLLFHSYHWDKASPDTSVDFTNLNDYKEYRDNKERINKAQILHFNYWIDSLVMQNNVPFDPEVHTDDVIFPFIRFYLQFARYTGGDPSNPNSYEPDPNEPMYLLGEYLDVNVAEYYRNPEYILDVSEETAMILSDAVKNRPQFYIITHYSKVVGQTEPKRYFPYVAARYDMVIRFDVDL